MDEDSKNLIQDILFYLNSTERRIRKLLNNAEETDKELKPAHHFLDYDSGKNINPNLEKIRGWLIEIDGLGKKLEESVLPTQEQESTSESQ